MLDAPARMLEYAVMMAALRGQAGRIRCLLAHAAPVNAKGTGHPFFGDHTALEVAQLGAHTETAQLLAAAGASGALRGLDSAEAAVMRGDREQLERLVSDDRRLVRRLLTRRRDLLIKAAEYGRTPAVRLACRLGFDVNAALPWTALHKAALAGDLEMAKTLVELGADRAKRDFDYHATPLEWARYARHAGVAEFLKQ